MALFDGKLLVYQRVPWSHIFPAQNLGPQTKNSWEVVPFSLGKSEVKEAECWVPIREMCTVLKCCDFGKPTSKKMVLAVLVNHLRWIGKIWKNHRSMSKYVKIMEEDHEKSIKISSSWFFGPQEAPWGDSASKDRDVSPHQNCDDQMVTSVSCVSIWKWLKIHEIHVEIELKIESIREILPCWSLLWSYWSHHASSVSWLRIFRATGFITESSWNAWTPEVTCGWKVRKSMKTSSKIYELRFFKAWIGLPTAWTGCCLWFGFTWLA